MGDGLIQVKASHHSMVVSNSLKADIRRSTCVLGPITHTLLNWVAIGPWNWTPGACQAKQPQTVALGYTWHLVSCSDHITPCNKTHTSPLRRLYPQAMLLRYFQRACRVMMIWSWAMDSAAMNLQKTEPSSAQRHKHRRAN